METWKHIEQNDLTRWQPACTKTRGQRKNHTGNPGVCEGLTEGGTPALIRRHRKFRKRKEGDRKVGRQGKGRKDVEDTLGL